MKIKHFIQALLLILVFGLLLLGCETSFGNSNTPEKNDTGNENGGNNENGSDKENGTDKPNIYRDYISFTTVSNTTFRQEAAVFSGGSIFSDIFDVAHGNGIFVAVGIAGQMARSLDGVNWTAVEHTGFGNRFRITRIGFGGGVFVATGTWGNVIVDGRITTIGRIAFSSNGINWIGANIDNFDVTRITDMTYGNGRFLITTSSGQIVYSTNGRDWTLVADSPLSNISGIAYGAGKFVAVSSSVNRVAFSTNGIDWTPVISSTFSGITYGNGKFLAWGDGIAKSVDGITWLPFSNTSGRIIYGAEKYVLWSGSNISYSLDSGETWNQVNSTLGTIQRIVYGNGRFVAVGGRQPGRIAFSNYQLLYNE